MTPHETRDFLQRYVAAVTADFDAGIEQYVADESLKEHGRFFESAFPGYRIEPLETVAEDGKIAVYAMFHGTHGGPLLGLAPTGKTVAVPFMIIYVVANDKIVDHHIVLNEGELLRQLGALPAAAPA
jgi:predicted ester cyclase